MTSEAKSNEDVILPYAEMVKKAERDGVDIMDYVNSMHAHVLNQRDALARQNKQIATLRSALAPFAAAAAHGKERYELLKAAEIGVMECDAAYKAKAIYHLCQKDFSDALSALERTPWAS